MNALLPTGEARLSHPRPLLKYVGGKSQLLWAILPAIDRLHPGKIDCYYEPFAGGLAVFFALVAAGKIKRAHLSDTNAELIHFYKLVQNHPQALIDALQKLKKKGFSEERYYEVRAWKPNDLPAQGARFLYLNKCGYNGLYRVNKKGGFNVPWGRRGRATPPEICDEEGIWAAHQALQCAAIDVSDFRPVCANLSRGVAKLLYLDPPYWPTRPTANFTSYTANEFKAIDQHGLAACFRDLAARKIPALLSNSSVPETRALYREFEHQRVLARRNVNSNGQGRGAVPELLVSAVFKKKAK